MHVTSPFDTFVHWCLPASQQARPVLVLAGSVAVGKSTFAAALRDAHRAGGIDTTIVGTDGFLLPNAELERRGLLLRKGYPETYDTDRLVAFVCAARDGASRAIVPSYSHEVFDVVGTQELHLGDVIVVEGVNALGPAIANVASHRAYLDAEEAVIREWYAARFLRLIAAAESDASSFYRRFVELDPPQRRAMSDHVWDTINAPNLRDHVRPTMVNADVVVHLLADHTIDRVAFLDLQEETG